MSVRGIGKPKPGGDAEETGEANFFFRGPKKLKRYVTKAAAVQELDIGIFMMKAIELDRDLGEKLEAEAARLKFWAARAGLSYEQDTAEILAALVKKGLSCQDVQCEQSSAPTPKPKPKK